jgi:SAM-dependent methyltransferase
MENLHTLVYTAFDSDPTPIRKFLEWLAHGYSLPSVLHLLDVGCGPGRMLGEFTKLGWHVTGLELDPDFYAQAQAVAAALPNAEVRKGGFSEIEQASEFDLIAAVNSPFAYLLGYEDQQDALARCYRALKAGGLLFLDVPNLLWFLKYERAPIVRHAEAEGNKIRFIEYHNFDFHIARFVQTNEYKVTAADGGSFTLCETHTHRITTPPDLIRLIDEAGFEQVQTFTQYKARHGEPLNGRTMLLAARKPLVKQSQ